MTSKTPATKRVAAGKTIAERMRIAREAQKKALIEAQSIIAQAKHADPVADSPAITTTTQWLSVISIIVSLVGVYYKREEIKKVFAKKAAPPSPILPRTTPPVDAAPKTAIRKMD